MLSKFLAAGAVKFGKQRIDGIGEENWNGKGGFKELVGEAIEPDFSNDRTRRVGFCFVQGVLPFQLGQIV